MNFLPEPVAVEFDDQLMSVALDDGQTIVVPLASYPLLHAASAEQRAAVWLSPGGLHWDGLDEDISVEGLMGVQSANDARRHAA